MTRRRIPPRHQRVLDNVTATPESATAIYRRIHGLPFHKSLTRSRRSDRRHVAKVLEELGRWGLICRSTGDAEGHPIPVYFLCESAPAQRVTPLFEPFG